MTVQAKPQPPKPLATAEEAARAIDNFGRIMDSLLATVETETALVRAGKLQGAAELETEKLKLSRDYALNADTIKRNRDFLARSLPEALRALRRRHDDFQAALRLNMTVLATAHAVSESIVRGVSGELARKNAPQTYGATGRSNVPGPRASEPLAVSRTL